MGEPASTDSHSLLVFLCHSSADKDRVRDLCEQLKKETGINPWLDTEQMLPGQNWRGRISKAVRSSDAVIVCLSQLSIDKEGYVNKEIKLALEIAEEKPDDAIFLIPIKLDDCEVPQRLSQWHWAALYDSSGYGRLVAALREARGKRRRLVPHRCSPRPQIHTPA
jgi:hypothetical protein